MDKLAIVKLNANSVELITADVIKNRSFVINDTVSLPINLTKDLNTDGIIKPAIVKDIVGVLHIYKKMCDQKGIIDIYALCTDAIKGAKNLQGFVNEIVNETDFRLQIVSASQEINYIYATIINTFNRPKGLIVNVDAYATEILMYNRRNVLETSILPIGYMNILEGQKDLNDTASTAKAIVDKVNESIKSLDYMSNLEEDYDVILTGKMAKYLGGLSRRAKKYPLDVEHNYVLNRDDVEKVYTAISQIGFNKSAKVKGVEVVDCPYLYSGILILKTILGAVNKDSYAISSFGIETAVMLNYTLPITLEKPISDCIGYSLQVINDFYDVKDNNTEQVYNLSMMLYKQLKVLHKLNRQYIKVLRIAAYLHDISRRVSPNDVAKNSFNIILSSPIYGVDHKDIVLSAFVSSLRETDNFNLADWVKYKDLVTEEDLVAVKKLATILKLAECLDITKFGNILDISCDILGDSVILKTITKDDAKFEIRQAMLNSVEFKKIFNKNLEIL